MFKLYISIITAYFENTITLYKRKRINSSTPADSWDRLEDQNNTGKEFLTSEAEAKVNR